ncbi:MAG TPA: zf-HC2 domain-containing protein [Sedimentisphaerales bacterium]|nr:zf-HC2 domain-containing protein [Sedimentisphaerales bacterium]
MVCDDYKDLLMGYLDNELSDEQRRRFEEHLAGCPDCAGELEEFKKLKAITDEVTLVEPEDRIWQDYWGGVYNRIERGIGWIMFSVAAIALAIYCGFRAIEGLIKDPNVEIVLKIGLLALIAGLAILFVSILRERLYFGKRDRYKDVRR